MDKLPALVKSRAMGGTSGAAIAPVIKSGFGSPDTVLGVLSSGGLRRNRRKGYFFVAVAALALPGPDPVTTLLELGSGEQIVGFADQTLRSG